MSKPINTRAKKCLDNYDWLYNEYVIKTKSISEISRDLSVNTATLRKRLVKFGFEIRKTTKGIKTSEDVLLKRHEKFYADKLYNNKEWLYDQYITQNKSLNEIRREFNISAELGKWLRKFDIPMRSSLSGIYSGNLGKHWSGYKQTPEHIAKRVCRGPKNGMYGKKHTPEELKKISEASSGCNNPNYGKHHSPEIIKKMRKPHLGIRGPNNPNWKNATHKYCEKFPFVCEPVRNKFGRLCFLSGIDEIENGERLSVHHVDYNKSQGCKGMKWSLLPLSRKWHSKTGHNRWYWFALLRDYWCYKYLTFHGMDIFDGPSRTEWLWEIYDPFNSL